MRTIFCQSSVLKLLIDDRLAAHTGRKLTSSCLGQADDATRLIEALRAEGKQVATTMDAAAHVITTYYKGTPPFEGETSGFVMRKGYAREAAAIILKEVKLVALQSQHMREGIKLFSTWCSRDTKEAFAGFADYLDAAFVLDPRDGDEVEDVVVHHAHLPYLLRKAGWHGTPYHLKAT